MKNEELINPACCIAANFLQPGELSPHTHKD